MVTTHAQGVQPVLWKFPFLQIAASPCDTLYVAKSAAVRRSNPDPFLNQVKQLDPQDMYPRSANDRRELSLLLEQLGDLFLFNVTTTACKDFAPHNADIAAWNRPPSSRSALP